MMSCGISVEAPTELVQKMSCKNWLQLGLQYKNVSHINGSTSPDNSFGLSSRMMVQKLSWTVDQEKFKK